MNNLSQYDKVNNLAKLSKSTLIKIIESGFSLNNIPNSEVKYIKNLERDIKEKLKEIKTEKLKEIIKQYISHEFVDFIVSFITDYNMHFAFYLKYKGYDISIIITKTYSSICQISCLENFEDVANELQDYVNILTNNYDSIRIQMSGVLDVLNEQ